MASSTIEAKSRISELSLAIINSIAVAISDNEPLEDIETMFTDSLAFRQELRSWEDEVTDLNILQHAVIHKHAEAVRFLCEWDEQLNRSAHTGINEPIHLACYVGALAIVKYFIEERNVHINRESIMRYCRAYCHIVIPSFNNKLTPLDVAIYGKQLECVLYLLEPTTIHVLESSKSFPTFYINPEYDSNFSSIHRACFLGNADCLKFLIECRQACYGKGMDLKDSLSNSPIHIAAWANSVECITMLLDAGANVNALDGYKNNALHTLMHFYAKPCKDWIKLVWLLVESGINVSALNSIGFSPLELAAMTCVNEKGLIELLSMAPDVNIPELRSQILDSIEYLLVNGAEFALEDQEGSVTKSLLHELVFEFETSNSSVLKSVHQCFEILLHHGADPNVRLFQYSYMGALSHLITRLPDVYTEDPVAAISLLELFLINGADPNLVGYAEEYPFERAWSQGLPKVFLQSILDFMSEDLICKLDIGGSHVTSPITVCLYDTYTSNEQALVEYRDVVEELMRPKVRSLKHLVKFSIRQHLKQNYKLIDQIPLPGQLKQYLHSCYC
ncbi:unnamed protein product [Owenia fusiformis]|uniref:Uncharacterized protein n=1 Tax=Owenia fusiformis TaxID=6347 RepID=A0A8J1TGU5_OWEFU|nr:unnamed protein product [Owenia fusiformis]